MGMTNKPKYIPVELCRYYEWMSKPVCLLGFRASLKCHSKLGQGNYCRFYEPSKYYPEGRKDEPEPTGNQG